MKNIWKESPEVTEIPAGAEVKPNDRSPGKLALLTAGHFMSDVYSCLLYILLPTWLRQFNQPFSGAGWLVFIRNASMAIFEPIGGFSADKTTRLLFPAGLALAALAMSLVGVAPNYYILVLLIVIATIGQSFFGPGAATEARNSSGELGGGGLAIFLAGGLVGAAFGPVIVASLVTSVDLKAVWLLVMPGLVIAALLYQQYKSRVVSFQRNNGSGAFFTGIISRSFIALALVLSLRGAAEIAIMSFLPILVEERGWNMVAAGVAVGTFKLAGAAGSIIVGFLSDRINWKPYAVASFFLPVMILYGLRHAEGMVALILVGLLGGVLLSSTSYTLFIAQNLLPSKTSTATGIVFSLSLLGGSLGTLGEGFLANFLGPESAFFISGTAFSLGAAVAMLGVRES